MKKISVLAFFLLPTLVGAFDSFQIAPTRESIPELVTGDGRFTKVVIKNYSGNSILFEHDAGVERRTMGAFDDVNLNRIFPGYLARKAAIESTRRTAEERRRRRMAEQDQFLKSNLQAAISKTLREDAPKGTAPFSCILVSGYDTYEIGEVPQLAVRIVNRSSEEVLFLGCLDGSSDRRRFPHCAYEIRNPRGELVPNLRGWCGNMNPLRTADFVPVPANDAFDPLGKGFFGGNPFHGIQVKESGTYRVRFVYSTSVHELRFYAGWPGFISIDDIQPLFDRVPHVELTSNELNLSFVDRLQ